MRRIGRERGKIHNTKKELEKEDFRRKVNTRNTVPDIIIACEDSVSAPTYFKSIVADLISNKLITQDSFVIAKHSHTEPSGVLKDLKSHVAKNGKTYKEFQHKWIVIDRDKERVNGGGHSAEDFNNALSGASSIKPQYNVEVAYANDAFELWYLLHFDAISTALTRDQINKRLIKKLKSINARKFINLNKDNIKTPHYTKCIYEELLDKQPQGIKNAENLLKSYGDSHNAERDNPSTTVHKLVEILNSLNTSK